MTDEKLIRLVDLVLAEDMRPARAIVMDLVSDACAGRLVLRDIGRPNLADKDKLALCASLVEHIAAQAKQDPPDWTRDIEAATVPVYLVKFGLPKMKALYEAETPEPLRRRHFYAPAGYLVPV
jgi:hypothetical protein